MDARPYVSFLPVMFVRFLKQIRILQDAQHMSVKTCQGCGASTEEERQALKLIGPSGQTV